jgi:aspartyl-tRNA(Asn)/glutamyl-tRNA(Gln) amidotransferase subunit B
MEEDAGKLIHDTWTDATKTDYNRCGVPLIEIVSEPDFRSGGEVIAYLEKLRSTLEYLGVSDCKMQEGSMRADVNLSVRPAGQEAFGTRTEMKNMNSFRAIARPSRMRRSGRSSCSKRGKASPRRRAAGTKTKNATFAMRSKENAQDYRYFPEPDLPPVEISDEWFEAVKASLPEMAEEKMRRYQRDYGLPEYDTQMITGECAMAAFFEETIALGADPKEVSNWIMGDTMRLLKDKAIETKDMRMTPSKLHRIVELVDAGTLNRNMAREVYEALFDEDTDVDAYVSLHNMEQVSDEDAIRASIAAILAEHQPTVDEYRSGKTKVFGFLVGQTMRAMRGKADPGLVNKLLKELLDQQ